jgi:hypothetical protein
LLIKAGLFNSAIGIVVDIIYDTGVYSPELPLIVLVQFEKNENTGYGAKKGLFPIQQFRCQS